MLKGKGIIQKFFLCMFACVLFVFGGAGVAQAYTVTYHGCNGNSWNSSDPTNAAQLPSECSGFLGPCSFYDGWECFVDEGGYYIISFGQSLSSYLTGDMTCSLHAGSIPPTFRIRYHGGNCANPSNPTQDSPSVDEIVQNGSVSYTIKSPENLSSQNLANLYSGLDNCVSFNGYYDYYGYNTTFSCNGSNCGSFVPADQAGGVSEGCIYNVDLYMTCDWTEYSVVYHGCDGTVDQNSAVIYNGSFNVLPYEDTNLSSNGYTFQNWNTAADGSGTTYSANSTYTMNTCAVSGTTVNLYALCSQDGYTITLEQQGADTSSVPTTLYTTASVGAYLESSRTNLMSTSANNITIPSKTAHTTSYNANAPQNTSVSAPGNSVATWTFNGFYESTADNSAQYIDDNGYITDGNNGGDTIAKNLSANDTWYAKWTANCVDVQSAPTAPTGYSFGGWYKNAAGTGDAVTQICADDDFDTLYAKWGPLVVSVTYLCLNEGPGAFAYYDTEFVMQNYGGNCQPGRTFLGWKCDHDFATGEGTHGVYNYDYPLENGVITGGTVVSKATEDVWCESQWTKRVLYSCGNGTGNAPTDSNQYVAGDSVTVLDNGAGNCVPPEGYLFGRWKCNNGVGNKVATNTFSYPDVDSDVTCTAMYDFNTVFLEWNPNGGQPSSIDTPESCFYGEDNGISGIAHPTKTGYTFNGWRLTYWQCYIPEIDTSKSGSSRGYINNNGGTYFSAEEFGLTQLGTFAVRFSYGQVNGRSKCSSLSTGDNPGDDDGDYCWCKVTGVIPTDGEQCDVDYFPWLFYGHTGGSCTSNCADFCAQALRNNWDNARVYMLTRPQ